MHPLARILPCLALATAATAAPFVSETFDKDPDAYIWRTHRATVADGRLLLHADGDETTFVNATLETIDPQARLDFSRAPVTITLTELEMGGQAPAEKQAFVVVLGSDRPAETAAGYVRLVFNGDGKSTLSVVGEKKDGRNIDRVLVSRTVAFPVREIVLTLDRQGYSLKITDSVSPISLTGKWDPTFDWTVWENSAPRLVVKGVRRPGPGSIEASISSFAIDTK